MIKKASITLALILINIALFAQGPHAAKLYGMTQYGGTDHRGTVFHYTPNTHTINVDYEFKVKVKGATPKSGIVTGNNGKYYGTTTAGGANNAGVIFQWDSISGVYTEPYNFTAGTGKDARGSMVLYNGKFYGMTNSGGLHNYGVIYEWNPATNVYTDKIDMDSINGKNPDGTLTLAGSKFYGFTRNGGLNNKGVLFEWDPSTNVYTKKYDFDGTTGGNPVGKLALFSGKFYAMTNTGGVNNKGVIYEWNYATNVYTKKMDFNGTNGAYPLGYLTLYSGKFYGLTYEGGIYETALASDHYGVLFEWNPATNAFIKKRDLGATAFSQQSTHGPMGSLTLKGNELWGSTTEGLMKGAIFCWNISTGAWSDYFINHRISPPYTRLQNEDYFQAPGNDAYEALLLSGNKLLGTSSTAGGNGVGCIYEYSVDSIRITRAVHMLASDGVYPKGSLSRIGNKLYGMTYLGGENHFGNIFEWDISTNQFTERVQFNGYTTGACPWSDLQYYNGKFYGTTQYGRSESNFVWNSWGNRHSNDIFSWDPVTNNYQVLLENTPVAFTPSFTLHNNMFYSTGSDGGAHGALASYDPVANVATSVVSFDGINGDFVMFQDFVSANGLTYYNGKYYGMTPSKSTTAGRFKGGIYEWDPVTNVITAKINFTDTTGYAPQGGLTLVGNVFYGLTSNLPVGFGALFKWDPATNVFEKKSGLGYIPGGGGPVISPRGTLTYSEGKLYGLGYGYELHNSAGNGVTFPGVVFEYDPVLESITDIKTFTYAGGQSNSGVNPGFTKLLEVIPNEIPVLSMLPSTRTICSSVNDSATFMLTDADNDSITFTITSSNPVLIPVSAISIDNAGSIYTISYSGNQPGTDTISVVANDGYGGTVSFSFIVIINALPDVSVTQTASTLTSEQNGATYQWIDCISNSIVPGANSQSFTAAVTGTYAAVVTSGSCTDTSACFPLTAVGIYETVTQNNSITIQPNPARDHVQVMITQNTKVNVKAVKVKNILGEVVLEQKEMAASINISMLVKGVYFITVETDNDIYTTKFIKQ